MSTPSFITEIDGVDDVSCAALGLKLSISDFMILPPSPEPFTKLRSIPFSFASIFASGDAFILPFSEDAAVLTAVDATVVC